eukprot:TRINITY_DN2121_c0_g1_i1.p1 TRINITY_DN2121_c0_g1~~TRINITY_DN2121_c0_g1_i1.p1  ORF type:complete len:368 (-),score=92.09 TRINITY_DN2121_c0_g1_i1:44-1147(-)
MRIVRLLATGVALASLLRANAIDVELQGRRILIDGTQVFIRGIDYSPTPIGHEGSYDSHSVPSIFNRDLPVISAMGANAVRVYSLPYYSNYSKYEPFLDACVDNGLYVALGFSVSANMDFTDPDVVQSKVDEFSDFVNIYKDHPAIFMWLVGNELNHNKDNNLDDVFSFIKQARDAAHAIDGRPVSTAVSDEHDMASFIANYDDSVDVWSTQLYRGATFGSFWTDFAASSSKPSLMTEFGCDAFNNITQQEDQPMQATFDGGLMQEIADNCDVSAGGFVFGYVDQWWKGGNKDEQSDSGKKSNNPDGASNEAWYGMFSTRRNPQEGQPDILTPREVCTTFTNVWGSFTCQKDPADALDLPVNNVQIQ